MDSPAAVMALSALGHETRLAVYRLLIQAGPEGVAAGVIAGRTGVAPSSLTFHLQHLQRAGLISQRRLARQIIYAADYGAMNALIGFLTRDCCGREGEAPSTVCCPAPESC